MFGDDIIMLSQTTAPVINMYRMWGLEDINYRKGDAYTDGELDIKDVTTIQKYIGDLEVFNNMQWYLADYNYDGTVSVLDVTAIQKHIAALRMIE